MGNSFGGGPYGKIEGNCGMIQMNGNSGINQMGSEGGGSGINQGGYSNMG